MPAHLHTEARGVDPVLGALASLNWGRESLRLAPHLVALRYDSATHARAEARLIARVIGPGTAVDWCLRLSCRQWMLSHMSKTRFGVRTFKRLVDFGVEVMFRSAHDSCAFAEPRRRQVLRMPRQLPLLLAHCSTIARLFLRASTVLFHASCCVGG